MTIDPPTPRAKRYDTNTVVIIGGGWQGSVAAISLAKIGYKVVIIDENDQLVIGTYGHCSRFPLSGIHWKNNQSAISIYNASERFFIHYPGAIVRENKYIKRCTTFYLFSKNSSFTQKEAQTLIHAVNKHHASRAKSIMANEGLHWKELWDVSALSATPDKHASSPSSTQSELIRNVPDLDFKKYCKDAVHAWEASEGVFDWEKLTKETQALLSYYQEKNDIIPFLNTHVEKMETRGNGSIALDLHDKRELTTQRIICRIAIDCTGRIASEHTEKAYNWPSVALVSQEHFKQSYKFHIEIKVQSSALERAGLLENLHSCILVWGPDGFSITVLDDIQSDTIRLCITSEEIIAQTPHPSSDVETLSKAVLDTIANKSTYWKNVFLHQIGPPILNGNAVVKSRAIDEDRGKPFVKTHTTSGKEPSLIMKVIADKLVIAPQNTHKMIQALRNYAQLHKPIKQKSYWLFLRPLQAISYSIQYLLATSVTFACWFSALSKQLSIQQIKKPGHPASKFVHFQDPMLSSEKPTRITRCSSCSTLTGSPHA